MESFPGHINKFSFGTYCVPGNLLSAGPSETTKYDFWPQIAHQLVIEKDT